MLARILLVRSILVDGMTCVPIRRSWRPKKDDESVGGLRTDDYDECEKSKQHISTEIDPCNPQTELVRGQLRLDACSHTTNDSSR